MNSESVHVSGCNTERRGCMPGCSNFDLAYDYASGDMTIGQLSDALNDVLRSAEQIFARDNEGAQASVTLPPKQDADGAPPTLLRWCKNDGQWGLWIQRGSDTKRLVSVLKAARRERVESAKLLVALSDALDEADGANEMELVGAIVAARAFVAGDE
jgi:hypothetical protein